VSLKLGAGGWDPRGGVKGGLPLYL